MNTYYTVLNITETATQVQIKKAYYVLAMKHHPDRQLSQSTVARKRATEKMALINRAYATLSNVSLKQAYDRKLYSLRHPVASVQYTVRPSYQSSYQYRRRKWYAFGMNKTEVTIIATLAFPGTVAFLNSFHIFIFPWWALVLALPLEVFAYAAVFCWIVIAYGMIRIFLRMERDIFKAYKNL